jgi:hypothetical protein
MVIYNSPNSRCYNFLNNNSLLYIEMQNQYRRVSFALLRLITGHNSGDGFESMNEDGAWCWRDGCHGKYSVKNY